MVVLTSPERPMGYGYHQHLGIRLLVPDSVVEEHEVTETPSKPHKPTKPVAIIYGYHPEIVLEYRLLDHNIEPKALLKVLRAPSGIDQMRLVSERRELLARLVEIDQKLVGINYSDGQANKSSLGELPKWVKAEIGIND